jgi:HK97 family phage portal protein
MSLVAAAFNPTPRASTSYGPTHDFWYTRDPSGYLLEAGGAGLAIGPDTIMRCGTVLAAVRFRGDSWAMCPPSTFIKTPDGRAEDPTHYSQLVLRNPNKWQTGNRWRHLNGVWMATWGNAYNEIRSGRRSFADELWPMHPRDVRVADQVSDGSLVYRHEPPGQEPRTLIQGRVLHFRDISTDGIVGLEMYRLIRNTVAIALMAEMHASTFLRKGTRVSGLLVPSAPLKKDQRDDLRSSVNEEFGGFTNTGALGVLPHGVDLKQLSQSNRDSQFVELGDRVVGAILRFLGVPGVVVGWMGDKTATYASAKEFFEAGGIKHTILPILTNVEAEEEKALLRPGDGRQIKHNLDALLRASWKDRIEGLVRATGGPIFSVNEARVIEDFDEIDDERYDRPHIPSNMMGGGDPDDESEPPEGPPRLPPAPPEDEEEDEEEMRRRHHLPLIDPAIPPLQPPPMMANVERLAREREQLRALVLDNAGRVLRREVEALAAKAPKLAKSKQRWRAFVLEFYGGHADYVAKTMRIEADGARSYCDQQASAVLAGGLAAVEKWEREVPERLVALALGGGE